MTGSYLPNSESSDTLLDIAFGEILEARSPYAYTIFTAIERYLKQSGLDDRQEAHEILVTAYQLGKARIQQGERIMHPHAWLKSTAFQIILQERNRVLPSITTEITLDPGPPASMPSLSPSAGLERQLAALWQAFYGLADEQPDMMRWLTWRLVDGLPWSAIQKRLQQLEEVVPDEAVLRRQIMVMKKRLRQVFHACERKP